jgi:hypothetical protein
MAYEYVDSLKGFFAKKNGKVSEKQMMWKGQSVNNPRKPDHTGPSIMYTGEIKNYRPHGFGEFMIKTGSGFPDYGYEGNWNDGMMEGEGKFFANEYNNHHAFSYEGSFKKNTFCGIGRLKTSFIPQTNTTFKPITILYDGLWIDGKRFGNGIQTWDHSENIVVSDQIVQIASIYDGEWKDDKFDGSGKLFSIFGWVYEGNFQNGKKHGLGKLIKKNGDIIEGFWENNSLKNS